MSSAASEVVRTVTQVITKTVASATPTPVNKATPQGGVLEKINPVHYDPKNPIILFIVQVSLASNNRQQLPWFRDPPEC